MNKYIVFLLLAVGLSFAACKKKNDFVGGDNFISSFTLQKGGTTFTAAITDSSIIISVPDGFSLDSAKATVKLSENASIYPNPSTIISWDDESLFVVDAHDGMKKSYTYTVQRSPVAVAGTVVLATQADVDAFGKQGVTEITGNLIIGSPSGSDSITNLAALFKLKKVDYAVIIYPTYSATQFVGLDNLQSIGTALQIEGVNNLVSAVFPSLATVGSISINNPLTEDIEFPKLTTVSKTLNIYAPLNKLSFPNLTQVNGQMTLDTDPSSGASLIPDIAFPALTSAGGLSISDFRQTVKLDLPSLTTVNGDLTFSNLTALYNLNTSALQKTTGTINISVPQNGSQSKLTEIDFPALTQAGGFYLGDMSSVTSFVLPSSLKTIGKLTIYNIVYTSPATIDVRGATIGEIVLTANGPVKLIGDDIFNGTLTISPQTANTFPTLQGFSEIDSLSFGAFASNISDLTIKGIKKIDKGFQMPFNNMQTFGMPDLQEVGGDFVLIPMQGLTQSSLEFPSLAKVDGSLNIQIQSTAVTALKCPALTSVGGDLQVGTGYDNRSLSVLSFPVLTSIKGKLKVYAENFPSVNTGLTDLSGFAALTSAASIEVSGQSVLTSFLGLQKVIPSITATGWTAANNAYNPSYDALVAGHWTN